MNLFELKDAVDSAVRQVVAKGNALRDYPVIVRTRSRHFVADFKDLELDVLSEPKFSKCVMIDVDTKSGERQDGSPKPYYSQEQKDFILALDESIEFHQNKTEDPHDVGTAVIVALTEVRNAYIKGFME